VTEAEWRDCTHFDLLWGALASRATARKRRLQECASCRRSWHLLRDEPDRRAVELAERYADGLASAEQLQKARDAVWKGIRSFGVSADPQSSEWWTHFGVLPAVSSDRELADAWRAGNREPEPPLTAEAWSGLELLRELVGNPFRTVALNPAWLTWQDGTVRELARAAYDERRLPEGTLDPARLAVLADALEDAGCTDAELLAHLRGPGPHVRGCWAVDLILGKE
jgi:hypothetical protein